MANIKISDLTALTPPAAADELAVVDVSASSTKKTTVGEVVGIINGDVEVATDGTATISELPVSKLQDGDARQLLQTNAAGTGVEWTDDVDLPGTLGVAGQSTLASAAVSDLTSGRVVLAGASGELEDSANLTFNGSELGVTGTLDVSSNATVGGDLTVVGDLTVEGSTTTLETQTVVVEDKNIELGVVTTPTDTTADGGGITLKGTTDKTINWVDATDAWTFSEHVNIASAKEYRIAGTKVLDATSLGSAVVSSSLTSVGTIGTGVWEGTTIATAYGGTGQTTYANGELLIGTTAGSLAKATLTPGGGIDITNGDGSVTVDVDIKANGGLVIESTELAVDLGASSITGTLGVSDGGTGQTTYTDGQLLIGNSTGNTLAKATLTAGTGIAVTNGSGTITLAIDSDIAITDITTAATTGTLPTADGSVTIADAAAPTVTELLEYCVELESKLEAALAALRTVGVIAT